jgi:hypothetical protein
MHDRRGRRGSGWFVTSSTRVSRSDDRGYPRYSLIPKKRRRITPLDVPRVSGVSTNTYETWMKHAVDHAGYAQTHCVPPCYVHMRQRCIDLRHV